MEQYPTDPTSDKPDDITGVQKKEPGRNAEDNNGPPSQHKQTRRQVAHPNRENPSVHHTYVLLSNTIIQVRQQRDT